MPNESDAFKRVLGLVGRNASRRSVLELVNSDDWRCVSDRTSSDPFELVYRAPLFVPDERDGFDYLLRFWWEFGKEGSFRLPTEAEASIIDSYTEVMRRRLTGRGRPLLLCGLSSDGMHQWLIAAKDSFSAQLEVIDVMGEAADAIKKSGRTVPAILTASALNERWPDVLEVQKVIERFGP